MDEKLPEEIEICESETEEKIVEEAAAEEIPAEEDEGVIITIDDDYLGPDSEEAEKEILDEIKARESHIGEYVAPKQNVFKRIESFWYRNKAVISIAIGAVAIIIYLIVTSIPAKYDIKAAMYISQTDFPINIQQEIAEDLANYCDDWDHNGEKAASVRKFDISDEGNFATAAYYGIVQEHLNGEPDQMLWIVDEGLYEMMVEGYGEEIFESYKGAPRWIEITWVDVLNRCVESGESDKFGICLLKMTDKYAADEDLSYNYEKAKIVLDRILEAHPEILTAE